MYKIRNERFDGKIIESIRLLDYSNEKQKEQLQITFTDKFRMTINLDPNSDVRTADKVSINVGKLEMGRLDGKCIESVYVLNYQSETEQKQLEMTFTDRSRLIIDLDESNDK